MDVKRICDISRLSAVFIVILPTFKEVLLTETGAVRPDLEIFQAPAGLCHEIFCKPYNS
jgi:hypothetical protein